MQAGQASPPSPTGPKGIFTLPRRWYRRYDLFLLAFSVAMLFLWPSLWRNILSSGNFMSHGMCYFWIPELVALHLVSDVLIGLSYVAISATLTFLIHRARRDMPFHWVFLAFGLFIVACGMTHWMEVWTIWNATYWLSGYVKLVTAVASVATAVVLPPLVPKTLQMLQAAKVSESRRGELERANEELERRGAELEAVNRELESFSYSVSHDLRAPLRVIDGFSHALLEDYSGKLDAEGEDYLRRVRAASQQMGQLIDDLLLLSRVTRTDIRREPVDLSAMARSIIEELRASEPERRVEFTVAEKLSALGDGRLLRIALENLLGNAWKFTARREDARVEFGATERDGQAVYYVRDNGAGFDMDYAGKLFGPFQRLHHAEEFEGTGVGLATVQRVVSRHGGRVWAEGVVNRGATFYFTLSS